MQATGNATGGDELEAVAGLNGLSESRGFDPAREGGVGEGVIAAGIHLAESGGDGCEVHGKGDTRKGGGLVPAFHFGEICLEPQLTAKHQIASGADMAPLRDAAS